MKNLRKLNPLVYWVIMSVWITLKIILQLFELLAKIILLIMGGFLVAGALSSNRKNEQQNNEEHNPFVYGTQGRITGTPTLTSEQKRRRRQEQGYLV